MAMRGKDTNPNSSWFRTNAKKRNLKRQVEEVDMMKIAIISNIVETWLRENPNTKLPPIIKIEYEDLVFYYNTKTQTQELVQKNPLEPSPVS